MTDLTVNLMKCKCDHGPRNLDIGEGTVYCGICKGPVQFTEPLNAKIVLNGIQLQVRIDELLTEILRLQADVYRLSEQAKDDAALITNLRNSLNQLDPR